MAFKKCEDCGNVFWGNSELKFCPVCAVVEKAGAKTTEPHEEPESNERQLQPAAA